MLIADGDYHRMVPSVLFTDSCRRITDSEPVCYLDSGHGSIFQSYAESSTRVVQFLGR
ncbi:hypothetical protein [Rathayibacter sp. PhB152]|uniref:hypothetical protein n=1 Tax=Rathayibacter sp. PhB152 TaxID=2485190 RepID=UPI001609B5AA|nr:hypothetical protein [Rathayibacter sp. PhB152]